MYIWHGIRVVLNYFRAQCRLYIFHGLLVYVNYRLQKKKTEQTWSRQQKRVLIPVSVRDGFFDIKLIKSSRRKGKSVKRWACICWTILLEAFLCTISDCRLMTDPFCSFKHQKRCTEKNPTSIQMGCEGCSVLLCCMIVGDSTPTPCLRSPQRTTGCEPVTLAAPD